MEAPRDYRLRDFRTEDSDAIRRLNDSEIPSVTLFAPGELNRLAAQAASFRVAESPAGESIGFLLALDHAAVYASLNFQWFKARYPRFLYVDRVVVGASARSQGVGRILYEDLLSRLGSSYPLLTCEVNIRPANPKSLSFHKMLGFQEVGVQETEGGKKTVSLLAMPLSDQSTGASA